MAIYTVCLTERGSFSPEGETALEASERHVLAKKAKGRPHKTGRTSLQSPLHLLKSTLDYLNKRY